MLSSVISYLAYSGILPRSGPEEVRIEMAEDLSLVPLTSEDKSRAAQRAAFALVEMLGSPNPVARASALKALRSLSTLPSNGNVLLQTGVLTPLMRDLFVVGANQVPTKLKEISATVLANVVGSGANWEVVPVDKEGNTLASEHIVHNFLHLISNTGPAIEVKLLQVSVPFLATVVSEPYLTLLMNLSVHPK